MKATFVQKIKPWFMVYKNISTWTLKWQLIFSKLFELFSCLLSLEFWWFSTFILTIVRFFIYLKFIFLSKCSSILIPKLLWPSLHIYDLNSGKNWIYKSMKALQCSIAWATVSFYSSCCWVKVRFLGREEQCVFSFMQSAQHARPARRLCYRCALPVCNPLNPATI